MFPVDHLVWETVPPQGDVRDTLLCPHAGLLTIAGGVVRPAS
jgi:hypothetical protein